MSNAGKYKNVKSSDFAGPNGTYPINTLKRAKSALRLAHFASNPGNIVSKVYKKYPELKEQDKDKEKKKFLNKNKLKIMGKDKKEHKEEVKVEKVKVDLVTRPGGGVTVDNKKTSRRFK